MAVFVHVTGSSARPEGPRGWFVHVTGRCTWQVRARDRKVHVTGRSTWLVRARDRKVRVAGSWVLVAAPVMAMVKRARDISGAISAYISIELSSVQHAASPRRDQSVYLAQPASVSGRAGLAGGTRGIEPLWP